MGAGAAFAAAAAAAAAAGAVVDFAAAAAEALIDDSPIGFTWAEICDQDTDAGCNSRLSCEIDTVRRAPRARWPQLRWQSWMPAQLVP